MIVTVTLNPAVDKTMEIGNFRTGAVNRGTILRTDAGGKGINVSKVIQCLGGSSTAVGLLGGEAGSFIKACLDRQEIENDFLFIRGQTRTNIKIVDPVLKINTDINEPGPPVSSEEIEAVKQKLVRLLRKDDIVVFSGSVPANVDTSIYGNWIRRMKEAGVKTILDADGELLRKGIEAGPAIIKPNIHELETLSGSKLKDARHAAELAADMAGKYGIELVTVSLGPEGAIFAGKGCIAWVRSVAVEVKSTVGAGDSMVAALAWSLERNYGFERAARLAVAAGTANVMTSGTQPAALETILELEKQMKLEYLE